jgi:hypothetical protein
MGDPEWTMAEARGRRALQDGLARAGLDADAVWVDYLTLGGALSAEDLVAAVAGGLPLSRRDHDLLAHAVNERMPPDGTQVPYSDQLG